MNSANGLKTQVLSALHKVFPFIDPEGADYVSGSCLNNEPFSFQLAYRCEEDYHARGLNVRVESDLPIHCYRVDCVPVYDTHNTDNEGPEDPVGPGLFPDLLMPRMTNPAIANEGFQWADRYFEMGEKAIVHAIPTCWQSLWFVVNEDYATVPAGEHVITLRIYAQDTNALLEEKTFTLTVLSTSLPKQTLLYTNWVHSDCLCDMHHVDMFSDAFFTILQDYAHKAIRNGMNMMYLPAFTPPLDVSVGCYRRKTQLVGVTAHTEGEQTCYDFDFSLMERYINACMAGGVTHFEHSHMFTQWGATSAPRIYATVDGVEQPIFGWDTAANSQEYATFLSQYFPAVRAFMKARDLDDKVLYHISDEPQDEHVESYRNARNVAVPYLEGCMVGDALSNYAYFEQGLATMPIVATNCIDRFLGKCDNLWAYYTGEQVMDNLSNRQLNFPSYRNRILGMQLYRYAIKGFLNWNYNYCYHVLSHGVYDPCCNPGGYLMHTGGAMIYPGRDGTAMQSIRQKVFGDGINDFRALQRLESLVGRAATEAFLDNLFGGQLTFHTCPTSAEQLLAVREAINAEIAKNL